MSPFLAGQALAARKKIYRPDPPRRRIPQTDHDSMRVLVVGGTLGVQAEIMLISPGKRTSRSDAVGYNSPSQFSREYRRVFGAAPSQDAARLQTAAIVQE